MIEITTTPPTDAGETNRAAAMRQVEQLLAAGDFSGAAAVHERAALHLRALEPHMPDAVSEAQLADLADQIRARRDDGDEQLTLTWAEAETLIGPGLYFRGLPAAGRFPLSFNGQIIGQVDDAGAEVFRRGQAQLVSIGAERTAHGSAG